MTNPVFVTVLVGMILMMNIGCSNSDSSISPESQLAGKNSQKGDKAVAENIHALSGENRTKYFKGVEGKLKLLKAKHAKLASHQPKAGPGPNSKIVLDSILKELTKEGEEVLWQIEAMKSANGEDHPPLQAGMDLTLEELNHSYDKALDQFLG